MQNFGRRSIHSSIKLEYPRLPFQPKKLPPNTSPRQPSKKVLEELQEKQNQPLNAFKLSYPKPFPPKRGEPFHIRQKQQKIRFSKTNIIPPLPTTFASPQDSIDNWCKRPLMEPMENRVSGSQHHDMPYKYYEITLIRSLIGLDHKTKHIAQSLGLLKRHQVVWRMVSPRSAGQIIALKELVRVRLVHETSPKYPIHKGYTKLESAF